MRKRIIFLALMMALPLGAVQGQILISLLFGDKLNNEHLEFGLDVSGNFSTITGMGDVKNGRGLAMGLFFDYKITDHFVLASSLLFKSPKGVRSFGPDQYFFELPDTIYTGAKSTRRITYFDLPIVMQYRVKPWAGIGLGIQPSLAFLADDSYRHDYQNWAIGANSDIMEYLNRWDFAFVSSLNVHLKGDPGVQIRLNYAHGMVNIYDPSTGRTGYNRTIQLGAMIPIKASLPMPKGKN